MHTLQYSMRILPTSKVELALCCGPGKNIFRGLYETSINQ